MSSSGRHFAVKRNPSSKRDDPPSKRSPTSAQTRSNTGLRGRGKNMPSRHFCGNAVYNEWETFKQLPMSFWPSQS